MADRVFIQTQLKKLETNFGKERFKVTQPMFELWAEMFKDLNEDGIKASVDEYIRTSEYPPNIASIMKIYNAKEQARDELSKFLKMKYAWMCRWYGEGKNDTDYKQIVAFVIKHPASERKTAIDEMCREAVAFYNDCLENGEPVTIHKFLEGYLWMQKDS